MAEIKLFRIDSRLIHGQIITKWLKVTQADKIVVVDEMLAADDFYEGGLCGRCTERNFCGYL